MELNKVVWPLAIVIGGIAFLSFKSNESKAIVYEYKQITVVESVVPKGLGRSRIIEQIDEIDVDTLTTERTNGTSSQMKTIKRESAKIDKFKETKILNFYSLVGINFQNIASNDALITSKINSLSQEGWELSFVASGVESDGGKPDGNGIYVTRYIFKKLK